MKAFFPLSLEDPSSLSEAGSPVLLCSELLGIGAGAAGPGRSERRAETGCAVRAVRAVRCSLTKVARGG